MIGVGIAGTGSMAERMARAIMASKVAVVARVSSSSQERARACASRWRGAAHGGYREMLEDSAVDAIYIAGRNLDHAALSIAALEAGKPVLCEKPFAMSLTEAEAVIAAARRNRTLYMEAVATPFLPAVQRALAIVGSGRLGVIRRIEASFGYPADRATHPALFEVDGGVLADRAVYPLMLALLFLGDGVELLKADVERRDGVDVAARLQIADAAGVLAMLAVSFTERLDNHMDIACGSGAIDIAPPLLTACRVAIRRFKRVEARALRQHPIARRLADLAAHVTGRWHPYGASPYLPLLHHFCGLLRDGVAESPVLTHARMLDVARLIDEARAE